VWNSLPDHVVDVNSLKLFKSRLDKFWGNQNVLFDWTDKITGTRDRSECKLHVDNNYKVPLFLELLTKIWLWRHLQPFLLIAD